MRFLTFLAFGSLLVPSMALAQSKPGTDVFHTNGVFTDRKTAQETLKSITAHARSIQNFDKHNSVEFYPRILTGSPK